MKVINLNRSQELLGKKLTRGYQIEQPFFSHVINGFVGNIRTALTYLSRDGVDINWVAKTKLNKFELNHIVNLPKRKIPDYDNALKTLLSERIRNDKTIAVELANYYNKEKNYFLVEFIAADENNRNFEDMARYCKILNRLMIDPIFVNVVLDVAKDKVEAKPYKRNIDIKNIKGKAKEKISKTFDKSRPFIKQKSDDAKPVFKKEKKTDTRTVEEKKRVVKNFKKQLPYTKQ